MDSLSLWPSRHFWFSECFSAQTVYIYKLHICIAKQVHQALNDYFYIDNNNNSNTYNYNNNTSYHNHNYNNDNNNDSNKDNNNNKIIRLHHVLSTFYDIYKQPAKYIHIAPSFSSSSPSPSAFCSSSPSPSPFLSQSQPSQPSSLPPPVQAHSQIPNKYAIDIHDCWQAHTNICGLAHETPVMTSSTLNDLSKLSLYFKCEIFQKVGAFKFRGAINGVKRFIQESKEGTPRIVVTHSSGNHAQAVGKQLTTPHTSS